MLYHSNIPGGYMVVKTAAEHEAVLALLEPHVEIIEKPKAKKAPALKFDME